MATDRWEQVKKLFEAALERDPSTRSEFLEGAFALDPSIRGEVESLISSHEESDSYLEKPPVLEVGDSMPHDEDTASATRIRQGKEDFDEGRQIGPYSRAATLRRSRGTASLCLPICAVRLRKQSPENAAHR